MTLDADTALEPLTPTRRPQARPVEVCAAVERVGRSATTVSLRLEQDGRPVALAFGACATWRAGEPERAEPAPEAPRPLGQLALTALSDGWMPAAFSKLARPVSAPTVDLMIHFRAPLAPGEWVLADYRSRFSAGGAREEDGQLCAADGTLPAPSRRLALIRA